MTDRKKHLLARRHRAEKRFKYLGLGAVLLACSFLVMLLATVVGKGLPAFTHYYLKVPLDFTNYVDASAPEKGDYNLVYKKGVASLLPFMRERKAKRIATRLVSGGAGIELQNQIVANPQLLDSLSEAWLPFDDYADLYLKGLIAENHPRTIEGPIRFQQLSGEIIIESDNGDSGIFLTALKAVKNNLDKEKARISDLIASKKIERASRREIGQSDSRLSALADEILQLETQLANLSKRQSNLDIGERLDRTTPGILVEINGAIAKITQLSRDKATGKLITPMAEGGAGRADSLKIRVINSPENSRKFSDVQIALVEHLRNQGRIEKHWNTIFFTRGASREPEQAGIFGAVMGSLLTMVITLALAFPLGISTAIYLEEFAPKNKLTALIEVNINNLAAVPSIIFGLLGLAVFLNWFQFPRSAPLVGGLVLALMTLPTIIIASRAALKAVPPSIRDAAMGIGASKVQTVFHHVLPLAMPGMLTGTILGMAQALGETAPLLMIGMVAFIVDIPLTFSDPATVMPVQIYMWADFPEPAFQQKTAAAILILLAFLIVMNALAVLLRRRFERRW